MRIPKEKFDKIFNSSESTYVGNSPLLYAWLKSKNRDKELQNTAIHTYNLSEEVAQIVKKIAIAERCNETLVIESLVMAYAAAKDLFASDSQHIKTG